MRSLIFSIVLLFAAYASKAQTVDWGTVMPISSIAYTVTSDNTSFTYDSYLLNANFRLDADGHTMHYNVMAKNIPYSSGNRSAEFQTHIAYDGWPILYYAKKLALWNVSPAAGYGPDYDYESYPTTSDYSYSGSFDMTTTETIPFWMYIGILYWDDADYFEDAGFQLFPALIP